MADQPPHLFHGRFVLAVNNLDISSAFYTQVLGFISVWREDGWEMVSRDNVNIMLGECPDDKPAAEIGCHSYFAYIETQEIEKLYEQYKKAGVNMTSELENKAWGMREFGIMTIDGHRITFGQEI